MPSIVAKIIRIVPIAYKSYPVKHMCVRAELYGCPYDFGNIMLHSHTLNFLPRVHVTLVTWTRCYVVSSVHSCGTILCVPNVRFL